VLLSVIGGYRRGTTREGITTPTELLDDRDIGSISFEVSRGMRSLAGSGSSGKDFVREFI
jgi:hypothetical protein